MKRRIIVAVSVSGALGVAIALVLWWRTPGDTDDLRDFDWDAIKAMIVTGASTNDRYSVEEVKLDRVPMPSAKVFFVVDKQFEALLGPKQALVLYYPEAKALNHDPELLKMIFERRQYKANSPDELLTLVAEVAPLLYGSRPAQHEILTRSNMVGSGSFPITTDTIQIHGEDAGMFVNYYARIAPWGDIVNVTAVLKGQRLQVSLHAIHLVPRVYE